MMKKLLKERYLRIDVGKVTKDFFTESWKEIWVRQFDIAQCSTFSKKMETQTRMENGGKRKRVGLSLKSFKKPALDYVKLKKPSFGKRSDEVPSRTGKATSATSLSSQEKIEIPISENR